MAADAVETKAELWGRLWGTRADEWASTEEQQLPTYEAAIDRLGIRAEDRVLEVGCGSGVFLRAAADRGAAVTGIDSSERLVELARARAPEAEVSVGDLQALPYADGSFDVVAGFNSFFFADDIVAALREAGRVARPGGKVAIQCGDGTGPARSMRSSRSCGRSSRGPTRTLHRRRTSPSPAGWSGWQPQPG